LKDNSFSGGDVLPMIKDSFDPRPAGYEALLRKFDLEVIPNWHVSFVAKSNIHQTRSTNGVIEEIFTSRYWPGNNLGDHLEFALKYDGFNLATLDSIFEVMDEKEFLDYLKSKPTGKYSRRLWFIFELLTGKILPLRDINQGNYVDLLDKDRYYTLEPSLKVPRQRINNNLPGNIKFCPLVRKTSVLKEFEAKDLSNQCKEIIASFSPELLRRALGYLYTKETKSSFEIEHLRPSSTRTERFLSLLRLAEEKDFCSREELIGLQNRIVDPRFRDNDYRSVQNYVGETVAREWERIHFVAPKPEDLKNLMDGLIDVNRKMGYSSFHPLVHAAVVAYSFVFFHPFEDGNGRIHRFLVHNILARRGFSPKGTMLPVSASMLKDRTKYDESLEAFSKGLMPLVEYSLDSEGRMTVHNDTARWYRYMDMTPQAEALFSFVEETIRIELKKELVFLLNYDETKKAIQKTVDMPDVKIDLFIRFCLQNNGQISKKKREGHFSFLTDDEVELMERVIEDKYGNIMETGD